MTVETKHLTTLVELSHRRHSPQGADLQRGLHLARVFEADPSVPIAHRSLAWHVITETHASAGWPMPKGERFPACCGASASTKHGCALLTDDIVEQIDAVNGRILVLGALAASRSVFGDWSILPTSGAYLVPFDAPTETRTPANVYRDAVGVRWGSTGGLRELFESHSIEVELAGRDVLIPSPEMIAARTSRCTANPAALECLIFCGAAHASAVADVWDEVSTIAPKIDAKPSPKEAAYLLGIDRWLGVGISSPKRTLFALRHLFRRRRTA